MIKGNSYKERAAYQLDEWVKGNSIHNDVDDECCPDFSCCNPNLLQPKEIRETFKALKIESDKELEAFKKDNTISTPKYNAMESMLYSFLGNAFGAAASDKNIFIINGHTEIESELN